jgi:hypothetical protein
MANTTFVDQSTVVNAAWLNDVNDLIYEATIPVGTLKPVAANKILYSNGATTVTWSTAAAANQILTSNGSAVPTFASALPIAVISGSISGNGMVSNSAGTLTARTITGTASNVSVINGDGIAGAPTINLIDTAVTPNTYGTATNVGTFTVDQKGRLTSASSTAIQITESQVTNLVTDLAAKQPLDATLTSLAAYNTNGVICQTAADTFAGRTLTAPTEGFTITNPAGIAGNPTFVLSNDLAGLEGLSSTGIPARTATDTWAVRTLTAPSAGFTITNPAGIAGNPTFVLADDLSGLEGLSTNGLAVRTGTSTWTTRSITGTTNLITVTNGDGVAGAPTITVGSLVMQTDQVQTNTANKSFNSGTLLINGSTSGTVALTATGAMGTVTANLPPNNIDFTTGAFHAYQSVGTSCNTGTTTELVLDSKVFDLNTWFNTTTGRYTPQKAGKYVFQAASGFNSANAACGIQIVIGKNGSAGGFTAVQRTTAANQTCVPFVSCIYDMNGSTDYVSIHAFQDGGGTETSLTGQGISFLSGYKLPY